MKVTWHFTACSVLLGLTATLGFGGAHAEDGFTLLLRAVKESPPDVVKADAPLSEIGDFVERGGAAWELCASALEAKLEVPSTLELSAVTQFRPLFRLLQQRTRYALRSDDPRMALDTLQALIGIAQAFTTDVDHPAREGGFMADIYLTGALESAASKLDRDSCQYVSELLEDYLKSWEAVRPTVETAMDRDRRKLGDGAVQTLARSGAYERGQQRLETRLKLHGTIFRLFIVKLQIRRFVLKFGRLPTNLEQIEDIEAVDPYDPRKRSFRYRVNQPTYTLYSVGPDGQDDGGESLNYAELLSGKKGDLVP